MTTYRTNNIEDAFKKCENVEKKLHNNIDTIKNKPLLLSPLCESMTSRTIWGSEGRHCSDYIYGFDPYINQGKQEFTELLKKVETLNDNAVGLEIGFFKGGTHLIFREFFKHFISIDIDASWFLAYIRNNIFDERSELIAGSSQHPIVTRKVEELVDGSLGFVFIDGDHSYEGVKNDFLTYWPMINTGGLIAIHDANPISGWPGIDKFIHELKDNNFSLEVIGKDYSGIALIVKNKANKNLPLPQTHLLTTFKKIPENSRVCLYGAGNAGIRWKRTIKEFRPDVIISCFADTFKSGEKDGLKIINRDELKKCQGEFDLILITTLYGNDVVNLFERDGITNYLITPVR